MSSRRIFRINARYRRRNVEVVNVRNTSEKNETVSSGMYGIRRVNSRGFGLCNLFLAGIAALLTAGCPDAPVILIQPQSQTVEAGNVASFTCVAIGAWPLSYQWKKDGAELWAANLATYATPPVNGLYAGQYICEVSNAYGKAVSRPATLTVVASSYTEDYQRGFLAGFANDEWYWKGFDDSYDTRSNTPIYYQGGDIPNPQSPDYDRGYYDGIWYAYNDGYFVCYDFAFTIGFSEGYDAAFYSGYLTFLENDTHLELGDGGWDDGYNDGFSEGRVFGAFDFEDGRAFDWMDAMDDYRGGTDLYFQEVDVGTGEYGPVELYVYGTDPAETKARAIRGDAGKAHSISYRPLTAAEQALFNKKPTTSPRSSRKLTLNTTWLQRIEAYRSTIAGTK